MSPQPQETDGNGGTPSFFTLKPRSPEAARAYWEGFEMGMRAARDAIEGSLERYELLRRQAEHSTTHRPDRN